jgi:hypothetical protein
MILAELNFPLDISLNDNMIAYVHTEINEPNFVDSLIKQFNET